MPKAPPALDYGNDVAYDLDGKRIGDPELPWLRAKVFPYANYMPGP